MTEPTDQIIVICPHCDAENDLDAVDHQQCCNDCRGTIPVKRTDNSNEPELDGQTVVSGPELLPSVTGDEQESTSDELELFGLCEPFSTLIAITILILTVVFFVLLTVGSPSTILLQ